MQTQLPHATQANLHPDQQPGRPAPLSPALTIAIQGELGSFSHEAALALAAASAFSCEIAPCALSADVFRRLAVGEVDAAVIPIENSLAGSVLEHYDLLLAHDVVIEREYLLRIRHNLIGVPGATMAGLRTVYSHPIALDQCRGFFRQHPTVRAASFYDTAGSVKHILDRESAQAGSQAGAIASRQAASQYGGILLAEGIEDNPENYTRFFLLRRAAPTGANRLDQAPSAGRERSGPGPSDPGQAAPGRSGPVAPLGQGLLPDKVSLCFAVENRPGSLVDALSVFAVQHINLTRLESRPVPGSPWQYIFYADYQMEHPQKADAALAELAQHCTMVKELGRYRAAQHAP